MGLVCLLVLLVGSATAAAASGDVGTPPAAADGGGQGSDRLEAWVSLPLRMHGSGGVEASAATVLAESLRGRLDMMLTAHHLQLVEVEHWEEVRGSTDGVEGGASGIRTRHHSLDSPSLRLDARQDGFTLLTWMDEQRSGDRTERAPAATPGPAFGTHLPSTPVDPSPPPHDVIASAEHPDELLTRHLSMLHGAPWSDHAEPGDHESAARTYRVGDPREVRAIPAGDDVDPYGTLFGRPLPFEHTIPAGWYELQTLEAEHRLTGGIGGYLTGAQVVVHDDDGLLLRLQLGERVEARSGSVYVPEHGWTGPGTHQERITSYLQWRATDATLSLDHTGSAVHVFGHDLAFTLDGGVSVPFAAGTLATAEGDQIPIEAAKVTVMGPQVAGRLAPATGDGDRTRLNAEGDVQHATIAGQTAIDRSLAPAAAAVGLIALVGGAVALLWKNGGTLLLPLFSRVTRKKALTHETRNEIYTMVLENPGIATHEVVERLSVGWSTVTYHLDVLERTELVIAHRSGRFKRYFDRTSGHYSNGRKHLVSLLQNDTTAAVADAIRREPGIVQRRIAERLGIAPSSVNWHVRRLSDAGLVEKRRVHRAIALHPGPEWARVLPDTDVLAGAGAGARAGAGPAAATG